MTPLVPFWVLHIFFSFTRLQQRSLLSQLRSRFTRSRSLETCSRQPWLRSRFLPLRSHVNWLWRQVILSLWSRSDLHHHFRRFHRRCFGCWDTTSRLEGANLIWRIPSPTTPVFCNSTMVHLFLENNFSSLLEHLQQRHVSSQVIQRPLMRIAVRSRAREDEFAEASYEDSF